MAEHQVRYIALGALLLPVAIGVACYWIQKKQGCEYIELDENQGTLSKKKRNRLTSSSVQDLLSTTSIKDIISSQRMIILCAEDSLDHCLMTLYDNNISSIPVVDLTTRKYIGIVSTLDIAAYLASLFPTAHSFPTELPNKPLSEVVNFSNATPFVPQSNKLKLSELLNVFSGGIHSVPVEDDSGTIVNIISETDILRFLVENESQIPSLALHKDELISDLNIIQGFAKVVINQTVATMLPKVFKVGALAVVDSFGVLVGELSAKHFSSLSVHSFSDVYKSVAEWKTTLRAESTEKDISLYNILKLLVKSGTGRVWVVDDLGKPCGVVRSVDVLQYLASYIN